MDEETKQRQETQTRLNIGQSANAVAQQAAMQKQQESIKNPDYQEKIEDPDVESEVFDWAEDEFPTWLSGARTRGFRSEHYEQFSDLLNRTEATKRIVEARPGELVAGDDYLLAVEQGVGRDPNNPSRPDESELRREMSSAEKRVVRGLGTVATNLDSLSVGGRGLDATSTVTTESRVVDSKDEESRTLSERAGTLFD